MVGKGRSGGGAPPSSSWTCWSLKKMIARSISWNTTTTRRQYQSNDFLPTSTSNNSNANPAPSSSHLNVCAICLDPLNYHPGGGGANSGPTPAIFTAQCSHAFHFSCISSNVRHGSVTCPICRAHWTQLPRNLWSRYSLTTNHSHDPILQIIDDSIASFRVHRRSFLRSARYGDDDDDPLTSHPPNPHHHRLHISLLPLHPTIHLFHPRLISRAKKLCPSLLPPPSSSSGNGIGHSSHHPCSDTGAPVRVRAYLCVKLELQPATDLVIVASPNGPHLRLMKQAMALVILSLRPEDRLAIIAYSSEAEAEAEAEAAAARLFPLKRMTCRGKSAAIQVVDRLFHASSADPSVGMEKGFKVLKDRVCRNPESCILHLTDCPTLSCGYNNLGTGVGVEEVDQVKIYRFHLGFVLEGSQGYVMHKFEEFLGGMLGGVIRDIRLKITEDGRIIKLGELRGGEERRFALLLRKSAAGYYRVEYSYIEKGGGGTKDECYSKSGEMFIGIGVDSRNGSFQRRTNGRTINIATDNWEYHDTSLARRWAKHLHGNRLLIPSI